MSTGPRDQHSHHPAYKLGYEAGRMDDEEIYEPRIATLADHKHVISEAHLFRKDDSLVILPVFEQIEGGLQARWLETTVLLTVPGNALPPGRYTATLVGAHGSRTWPLLVR